MDDQTPDTPPEPARKRGGGPRTPEGKARSSMNALKHGFAARSPQAAEIIAQEAQKEFYQIYEMMYDHYRPRDALEEQLVRRIVRCAWRLRVAENMEKRLFERRAGADTPGTSYERVLNYERLVDIHLHRAIAALEKKRATENKLNRTNELPPRSR